MPGIPLPSSSPYDSIGTVLQMARVYAQDAAGPNGLSGDTLASSVPATAIYLNSAFRRLQDELIDAGVETLAKEVVISGITPVAVRDPSTTVYLDWEAYYDGANLNTDFRLPFDLVNPVKLWQRTAGSGGPFYPLDPCPSGLPNEFQGPQMLGWEWLSDKLRMNGATNALDLKLRYALYFPDLELGSDDKEELPVPIMRAGRALARLTALEYCAARGGTDTQALEASAMADIDKITNRTAARKQQVVYRRQSRR